MQDVTALSDGTSTTSGGAGINVGDSSLVTGCTAQSNGNSTNQSSIAGINCGAGCSLSGNVADANTANGISIGDDGAVSTNTIYNNTQVGLNNNGDSKTGFGDNVMYCNNGDCTGGPPGACVASGSGSEGDNICNGSAPF